MFCVKQFSFFFRKCHQGDDEADWMKAVLNDVRAGQQVVLENLMKSRATNKFLRTPRIHTTKPEKCETPILQDQFDIVDCTVVCENFDFPKRTLEIVNQYYANKSEMLASVQDNKMGSISDSLLSGCLDNPCNLKDDESLCKSELEIDEQNFGKLDEKLANQFDLEVMQKKVDAYEYRSILSFHLDIKRILNEKVLIGPKKSLRRQNFLSEYENQMKDVFPWFDIQNPMSLFEPMCVEDTCVKPAYEDHLYSDCFLVDHYKEKQKSNKVTNPPKWKSRKANLDYLDDMRICLFCHQCGDRSPDWEGRLLYFRQSEWVHVNCALWSSEVYEEVDGSLQNVGQALNRGFKLNCSSCFNKGATMGCCQAHCEANYHFACGIKSGAALKEDKTVFCYKHKDKYHSKSDTKGLKVERTVCVDLSESKRKQKRVNLNDVKVNIGSLVVDSLGVIVNETESPIPVGFSCSRIFWSTVDPNKLIRYFCKTKLSSQVKKNVDTGEHVVVDHECKEKEGLDMLRKFKLDVKEKEFKSFKKSIILPPNAVNEVWPHLTYQDLHQDPDTQTMPMKRQSQTTKRQLSPSFKSLGPHELAVNFESPNPILSPNKKLNKAIGNVLKRTPTKLSEDDLDLALDAGDFPLEAADNDLISAILGDTNFQEELEKSYPNVEQIHERHLKQEDNALKKVAQDVIIVRTWFNQNKKKKCTELSIQCSLPFDKHVFDMDIDYSDLIETEHVHSRSPDGTEYDYESDSSEQETISSNVSSVEGEEDLLEYVTENINEISCKKAKNTLSPASLNEVELLQKILSMSKEKIFDFRESEQIYELQKGQSNQLALKLPSKSSCFNEGTSEELMISEQATPDTPSPGEILPRPILQLDGVDDSIIQDKADETSSKAALPSSSQDSVDYETEIPPLIIKSQQQPSKVSNSSAVQVPLNAPQGSSTAQGQLEAPQDSVTVQGVPLKVVQDSSIVQGPAKLQDPSVLQGPVKVQAPPIVQGPSKLQDPLTIQGPMKVIQAPLNIQGPVKVQDPSIVQGPPKLQDSSIAQEPVKVQAPPIVQGPSKLQDPSTIQSPMKVFQGPVKVQDPSIVQGPLKVVQDPLTTQSKAEDVARMQQLLMSQKPLTLKDLGKEPANKRSKSRLESSKKRRLDVSNIKTEMEGLAQKPEDTTAQDSSTDHSNDSSPRKNFTIAGILSPTDGPTPNPEALLDDDIQEIAFVQGPSKKGIKSAKSSASSSFVRKLLPKASGCTNPVNKPLTQGFSSSNTSSASPSVFVHQMQSSEMHTDFSRNIQPTTGRNLQYVTSINNLPSVPSFGANPGSVSSFPQANYQLGAPPTVLQQVAQPVQSASFAANILQSQTQLQLMPQGYISAVPTQQFSYVTPQGIIVNQATPNLINFGSPIPPGLTAMQPVPNLTTPRAVMLNTLQHTPTPSYIPSAPSSGTPLPAPLPHSTIISMPSVSLPSQNPGQSFPVATSSSTPRKIARVQPQPPRKVIKPFASKPVTSSTTSTVTSGMLSSRVDPIKALSNMASHPMASSGSDVTSTSMTITHASSNKHGSDIGALKIVKTDDKQRSVGTQARIGAPLKVLTSRPWKGQDTQTTLQNVSVTPGPASSGISADDSSNCSSVLVLSRPDSTQSQEQIPDSSRTSSPSIHDEQNYVPTSSSRIGSIKGIELSSKSASSNAIKVVLQRNSEDNSLKIQEIAVRDASKAGKVEEPEVAIKTLKSKAKGTKKVKLKRAAFVANLDGCHQIPENKEDFVNEQYANIEPQAPSIWRPVDINKSNLSEDDYDPVEEESSVIYELTSEDGFRAESSDIMDLWQQVFKAVQEAREMHDKAPLAFNPLGQTGLQMLGLTHNALNYLIEQLPGAKDVKDFQKKDGEEVLVENPSGCARTEGFKDRSPLDMFSWLASSHRIPPHLKESFNNYSNDKEMQISLNRRATSLDLPMAMRFRHLPKTAKEAVGVYSSGIHGRGLYCKRDIQAGEMVIEYAGEEIRAILTDKREKYYEAKGIGCYMFKIDDDTVVDATMTGNAARFINHSCDPNCYSRIVDILGKKHIIIFANRKIWPGEELTYDYKFPIEDVKIPCNCGAKKCKKYMN